MHISNWKELGVNYKQVKKKIELMQMANEKIQEFKNRI